MVRPVVEDWLTEDSITKLQGWARQGLTNDQIANNMGIGTSTFYAWKAENKEIVDALKKGKEVVDFEVESELLKRTKGHIVNLKKTFKVKNKYYDECGKICEREELVIGIDEQYIPADVTACIYWLNNRMPKYWRTKIIDNSDDDKECVNIANALKELVNKNDITNT